MKKAHNVSRDKVLSQPVEAKPAGNAKNSGLTLKFPKHHSDHHQTVKSLGAGMKLGSEDIPVAACCWSCQSPITEDGVFALGKIFHKHCFRS